MKCNDVFFKDDFMGLTFTCDCGEVQRVQAPIELFSLHIGPSHIMHSCVCKKEYYIVFASNVALIDGVAYDYNQPGVLAEVTA